jgi:hypothetical protein
MRRYDEVIDDSCCPCPSQTRNDSMPRSHQIPMGRANRNWMTRPRYKYTRGRSGSSSLDFRLFRSPFDSPLWRSCDSSVTTTPFLEGSTKCTAEWRSFWERRNRRSPLACADSVVRAEDSPTATLIPVTLHSVVASAAAASSNAPISPTKRRDIIQGILYRSILASEGNAVRNWMSTSCSQALRQGALGWSLPCGPTGVFIMVSIAGAVSSFEVRTIFQCLFSMPSISCSTTVSRSCDWHLPEIDGFASLVKQEEGSRTNADGHYLCRFHSGHSDARRYLRKHLSFDPFDPFVSVA